MPAPSDKRRTVDDILGSTSDDFNALWESTPAAADDFEPIPPGVYRCLVSDGKLSTARSGTHSFKVEFLIIEGPHRNRKLWHDAWLTRDAFANTKRDLLKLGVTSREAMNRPPRSGIVVEVKVALRTENDGRQYNRVNGFKVVADAPPPEILDVDEDDEGTTDECDDDVPF
jgi:hypothetical protein